ncbi:MAG: MarR family winged helix-turn-helix transcriptional regulator [Gammaproteobacteria bacterium]|nr:MarR family winged helix-turn-helix transcriptional regulator [Gammaproteobacteria bacterium]
MTEFKSATPQQSVGLQFWKLHQYWQKRVLEVLNPLSLTHTQFVILATLKWYQSQNAQPTQQQISNVSGIDKMTLSKAIRQLEVQSYLAREKNSRDSRAVSLLITKTGSRILVSALKKVEQIDLEVLGVLGQKETLSLSNQLFAINEALDIG